MSIVDVTEMWSRSGGSLTSERGVLYAADIAFSAGYQVLTDDPEDKQELVLLADGVPQLGDRYEGDAYSMGTADVIVVKTAATRIGPVFWMVIVEYSGYPPNDRPELQWRSQATTEPIDMDVDGRAIVNVNNEPVDGLTKDVSDAILVVKRRFETFNPDIFLDYTESINSDVFIGRPAGTLRFMDFTAQNAFANDQENIGHWMVTGSFAYRRGYRVPQVQAWWKRYRNEGLYVRIPDDEGEPVVDEDERPVLVRAVDANNQPVTRPVLLKANGLQEYVDTNAVYLTRNVYTPLPYNALGFL